MSDLIGQRSKQFRLAERMANMDSRYKVPSCSVRLDSTMNNTNATTASIASQQSRSDYPVFKMPGLPMRNHTQIQQRSNSQLNSTISNSNMKYAIENLRKSYLNSYDSYLVKLENGAVQSEEQSLMMYTELNNIMSSAAKMCSSENKNESRPEIVYGKILKAVQCSLRQNATCSVQPCTSSQQPDLESQPCTSSQQPDIESQPDPTDFEDAAFHSTQIENHFEELKNRVERNPVSNPCSLSTASKYSAFQKYHQARLNQQNKDQGFGSKYSNNFNNYSKIPTETLLGIAGGSGQSNARLQETTSNNDRYSPDLSRFKVSRSKCDKNASRIDSARIKNTLSQKLDNTISFQYTPITNWTIKRTEKSGIELFGCDSRSLSNKPVSHGVVVSRKDNNLIKTNKGLFQLVGTMKKTNGLPSLVRKEFKSHFPRQWKKTLNDSGLFD